MMTPKQPEYMIALIFNYAAHDMDEAGTTPATEGRREFNKRDKQNRILGAARALFQSQGYSATTTQQVARAAGIAIGTLFLYARNKEDLLIQVFIEEIHEVIRRSDDAVSARGNLVTQLDAFFDAFFNYHAQDEVIAHELIRELTFLRNPEQRKNVQALVNTIIECVAVRVTRTIARKALDSVHNPRVISAAVFGLYYHHLQNWLGGYTDRTAAQSSLNEALRYLLRDLT